MSKVCPSCGGVTPGDAAFCPKCGHAFGAANVPPSRELAPPAYPPPYGQPPLNAPRRGPGCLAWIGGCVVLIVVGFIGLAIIGALLNSSSSGTRTRTGSGNRPQPPQHRAVGAATVLNVRGSGTKSTKTFTVGDEWDLGWSYNCSGFSDGTGNFIVSIERKGGGVSTQVGVNQLGANGDSTEHYHDGGTFFLEINSECTWAVKVVDRS